MYTGSDLATWVTSRVALRVAYLLGSNVVKLAHRVAYWSGGPESHTFAEAEMVKMPAVIEELVKTPMAQYIAPFLMQVPPFKAVFVETLPYADYRFGNETEARTWADTEGWETTNECQHVPITSSFASPSPS